MTKFRKKPILIEARQFDGTEGSFLDIAAWVKDGGGVMEVWQKVNGSIVSINTLEGQMVVDKDDWVIRGVAGEFYPCKPGIFAQTYDPEIE